MQFIVVLERDHKENEEFIHYCQWTGNDTELLKLIKVIEFADWSEFGGDYSQFYVSRTLLSESAVDEHIRMTEFGFKHNMFQKHTGTFTCPDFDYIREEYEAAFMLDDLLNECGLGDYFQKPTVAPAKT